MNISLFAARIRAVGAAEAVGFVELVRLAGLNPARDFKFADLSRTDLRRQDMRAFNLQGANLRGALIQETQFNNTVRRRQLRQAISGVPVILIPIGEGLLKIGHQVEDLGDDVLAPRQLLDGLAQLPDDPERRQRRIGAYIGDSTDLVRRRLSRRFRELSRTLKASGVSFIVVAPDRDLDFEVLSVVQGYLKRDGVRAMTFLLPLTMSHTEAEANLVTARIHALPEGSWVETAPLEHRSHVKSTPRLSRHEHARDLVFSFIWVVAKGHFHWGKVARRSWHSGASARLTDGVRRGRETLSAAIAREVTRDHWDGYEYADRHHVFVREDLYSADLGSILAGQLGGQRVSLELSTYPGRTGQLAEFYVISGGQQSQVWSALRLER